LTLKTMLLSIVALLTAAEPKDPQDAEVAKQYIKDRKKYDQTAAYWTKMYATAAAADSKAKPEESSEVTSGLRDAALYRMRRRRRAPRRMRL
jgi:ubiquitin-conjugating enzyme (huntingtin interacting protein 2)